MKLIRYIEYSLHVLVHLAAHTDGLSSIAGIAHAYGISHAHLMKVVQDLAHAGYVQTLRGRNGGIQLRVRAANISLCKLIRHTESGFDLFVCPSCATASACRLTEALAEAVGAFLGVLDKHSQADLAARRPQRCTMFAP